MLFLPPSQVLSPEIQRLEKLFSRATGAAKKGPSKGAGKSEGGKKKKKVNLLDMTRAQNMSIGLRSFKNLTSTDMALALGALDMDRFTIEQLHCLEEILPTDQEIRVVLGHRGSDADFGPAELFARSMGEVVRPQAKLSCLVLMKTFDQNCSDLTAQLEVVTRACDQAAGSKRLAELLTQVLAVGNVMNEGTQKGDAIGFTIDSLLKLTQTKSVCKKLTVLDYIVDAILEKDDQSPIDFVEELPDLEVYILPPAPLFIPSARPPKTPALFLSGL